MTREFGFAVVFVAAALVAVFQLDLDPTKGPERAPVTLNAPVAYEANFSFSIASYEISGTTRHIPGVTRREFDLVNNPMVVLDRWSKGWSYVIFPNEQSYGRRHLAMRERSMAILQYFLNRHGEKARKTGTEEFEGRTVTVYAIRDRGANFVLWATKEGVVVRFEGEAPVLGQTRRLEYSLRDLNLAPQDATLFSIPKGFKRTR